MLYNFPDQTIPESQKDEQWHKDHILNWVNFTTQNAYSEDKLELERLYFAYSAKVHPLDEKIIKKTITERYCDVNLGPGFDIYPLIEYTLEQLMGDYRSRPLRYFALVQNRDAVIAKLDEMYDAFLEKIMRKLHKEIEDEEGMSIPTENHDMEIPEDDDEDFFKNFRTASEKQAESNLYFLLVIKKEKEVLYQALLHYLIAGSVSLIMCKKDGHPSIKVAHPLYTDFDVDPHNVIIDNPQYYCYSELLSINEIYNNYDLDEKKKNIINKYAISFSAGNLRGQYSDFWFDKPNSNSGLRVRAVTLMWKSRVKKKFKRFYNSFGNEEMKILPEDYKPRKNDDIVTVEIEDIRHCTMIGPDLVLEYGCQKDQLKAMGNHKKRFINVVAINSNNKTGTNIIRSVAKKIKFLQDYASEVLWELKLAMRQVDGGVLVYDYSNIPKEWMKYGLDKAVEKVNFLIKRDKMMLINSADKRSNSYASAVNISQKSKIQDLLNMLSLLENLAAKISGVNGSKMGDQADYTKAGVAQMNLLQASSRIENVYGPFDTFVEKFLERIVLYAQHTYKEGEVFNYYAGDKSLQFLKIMPEIFMDDLGITLSDPRKELQAKEIIDQAASQMLPNMQDPQMILELIKIHMSDSASEAIEILERGIEEMKKAAEERQQQIIQAQEQQAKAVQDAAAAKTQDSRENNQKDIAVAQIYADNKLQSDKVKEVNENLRTAAKIESDLRKNASEKKETLETSEK